MRRSLRMGVVSREIETVVGGRVLHLAVTVSSLGPRRANTGFVLVLDDLTEMLRAQKSAAWQEVARRIAHEIKNPLTPIQLSAQRLSRFLDRRETPRIRPAADPELTALVQECSRLIEREVSTLAALVNEFSQFVRFPTAKLVPTDANTIVHEALEVFSGRLDGVTLKTALAENLPPVRADGGLLRSVVVNLIDNAAESLEHSASAKSSSPPAITPTPKPSKFACRHRPRHLARRQRQTLPPAIFHQGPRHRPRPGHRRAHHRRTRRHHSRGRQSSRRLALSSSNFPSRKLSPSPPATHRTLGVGSLLDDHQAASLDRRRRSRASANPSPPFSKTKATSSTPSAPPKKPSSASSSGELEVILLDVWLPGMDGLEALSRIQAPPHPPAVIMISGHGTIETAVRATKLGAFDFIEKPLSLEKIIRPRAQRHPAAPPGRRKPDPAQSSSAIAIRSSATASP